MEGTSEATEEMKLGKREEEEDEDEMEQDKQFCHAESHGRSINIFTFLTAANDDDAVFRMS